MLDALEATFLREGFRHLTVSDLTRAGHTSRRTLSRLGRSKEEVVVRIVDRYFDHLGQDAQQRARAATNVREQIEAYLAASVDRGPRASQQFVRDVELYGPTRHVHDRHQEIVTRELETLVRRAMQRGEVADGTPTLWAEILGVVIGRLRDPEVLQRLGATRADSLRLLGHVCRHGLT